jgi:pimeloyl-ACP methyl ester carboxylesterase
LGATATSIALAQGLEAEQAVLLAPVAFVEPLLEGFIQLHGLPDPLAAELREQFAARYSSKIISVPLSAKDFQIPAVIYHDPDDGDLPFSHGEAIAHAWSGAELVSAPGAGHWRILRDQTVIAGTLAFLTRNKT